MRCRCGRAARAGRPGSALSLLTRDELPYLLDLHLFLSRQLVPAPLSPEQGVIDDAAAAMAAAGGLVAAAAAAGASGKLAGRQSRFGVCLFWCAAGEGAPFDVGCCDVAATGFGAFSTAAGLVLL